MTLCRALRVIEVGTSTWRQITGSLSRNSMRTVAISLKLSNAALRPAGLMRPVWQSRSSSSRAGVGRGGSPDDRRCDDVAPRRAKPAGQYRGGQKMLSGVEGTPIDSQLKKSHLGRCLDRSRGGLAKKIYALTDVHGLP